MKRLLDFFLSGYAGEGLELRKKARMVILTCVAGSLADALVTTARAIVAFNPVNFAVGLIAIAAAIATAFLIRAKRYAAGVNLVMLVLSTGFFLIAFIEPFGDKSILYEYAVFDLFLIIALCLIAYKAYQMLAFVALYVGGAIALYAFKAVPAAAAGVDVSAIDLFQILAFIALCGAVGVFVLGLTKSSIAQAEAEAEANKKRADEIGRIVATLHAGLASGERLIASSAAASSALKSVEAELEGIRAEAAAQESGVASSRAKSGAIVGGSADVYASLSAQDKAVSGASASIATISGSIAGLSGLASSGRDAMAGLVKSATAGERQMDEAMRAMADVELSSGEMLSLVNVIVNVSEQTNLLAMNAAIEAAHAGAAGRGFAVVAAEIRKLAEETAKNTNTITESLKRNGSGVGRTLELTRLALASFQLMAAEVKDVHGSIESLLSGLRAIETESSSLSGELAGVSRAVGGVATSMGTVGELTRDADTGIASVSEKAKAIARRVSAVAGQYARIAGAMAIVEDIGRETVERMSAVDGEMRRINEASR